MKSGKREMLYSSSTLKPIFVVENSGTDFVIHIKKIKNRKEYYAEIN